MRKPLPLSLTIISLFFIVGISLLSETCNKHKQKKAAEVTFYTSVSDEMHNWILKQDFPFFTDSLAKSPFQLLPASVITSASDGFYYEFAQVGDTANYQHLSGKMKCIEEHNGMCDESRAVECIGKQPLSQKDFIAHQVTYAMTLSFHRMVIPTDTSELTAVILMVYRKSNLYGPCYGETANLTFYGKVQNGKFVILQYPKLADYNQ